VCIGLAPMLFCCKSGKWIGLKKTLLYVDTNTKKYED